jgi:hypothetical protein
MILNGFKQNYQKCEICGAEFDSFDSLKELVRIETEDKKQTCFTRHKMPLPNILYAVASLYGHKRPVFF